MKPDVFSTLEKAVERVGLANNSTVTIDTVHQKKPYTLITVRVNNSITGIGFSKMSPKDTWDSAIGFSIAVFRAVRDAKHKQLNLNNTKHAYASTESYTSTIDVHKKPSVYNYV